MIPIQYLIMLVLFNHFVADFVFQSNWMAQNKSKLMIPLLVHIGVYSLFLLIPFGWKYALINGGLHFSIDIWTSRLSSYFWKKQKVHEFFVVIGFDQFLHACCLILTLPLIRML